VLRYGLASKELPFDHQQRQTSVTLKEEAERVISDAQTVNRGVRLLTGLVDTSVVVEALGYKPEGRWFEIRWDD
jgi:hypothetical protein